MKIKKLGKLNTLTVELQLECPDCHNILKGDIPKVNNLFSAIQLGMAEDPIKFYIDYVLLDEINELYDEEIITTEQSIELQEYLADRINK